MVDKVENNLQDQDENIRDIYKEQKKVGLISFFAELPNFIAVLISAILAHSLIMWLDLVDSLGNVARSSSIFLSSYLIENNKVKNPKKLEYIVSMFCSVGILIGMIMLLYTSIVQIKHPEKPQESIVIAVLLKVINLAADIYVLVKQIKILKKGETDIVRTEYNGLVKDTVFDGITFIIVFISYIFIKYKWSWYVSPIVCLLLCISFIYKYIKDIYKLIKNKNK